MTALRPGLWGTALLSLLAIGAGACRSAGEAALAQATENAPGLRIDFEGNATFGRQALLDVLAEDLRELATDGIDRADVDDLAYTLELFHRGRGFPDAYVDYALEATGDSEGDAPASVARFSIDEGRRAQVVELVLTKAGPGGLAFEEEALRPFFSAPSGVFAGDGWWYVRAELERGASAVADYYRAQGYRSVAVSSPAVTWQDEQRTRARVEVLVEEGPRWVLAEVRLETPPELPDERRRVLAQLLESGRRDEQGRLLAYTLRLAYSLRAQLLERFGEWGHPDATCEVEESELETGQMRVRFVVRPGPRVRVRDVVVRGNEKTRTSFVKRRLTLESGEVVDSRELRASFARLFETGLFRAVSIELGDAEEITPGLDPTDARELDAEAQGGDTQEEPATVAEDQQAEAGEPSIEPDDRPDEVERDLVVDVLERPSLEVTVEPGYGSYEGPRLRIGAENSNLFGTGRSADVEATVGALAQKVSLGLGDRALFDSEFAGASSIYFDRREEPSFTLLERGFSLGVSRAWPRKDFEVSFGYRFRHSDVSDVEVVDEEIEELEEELDISSLVFTVARDTRDRFFAPSEGTLLRMQLEWASSLLGSEIDFVSGRFEASGFQPLPWDGGVLAGGVETGLIAPIADTRGIPLQVRLFNGGEDTVRSFEEDELGNLDANGEPIGGEAYSVVSLEVRQDLVGPLSTALFYDAGNLEPNHEQYIDFDDMRQAVGIGLRYMLPIGPVRLDAGWNPDARDGEDDWVVHLAVGLSF